MKFLKLLNKNKDLEPSTYDNVYGTLVEKKIRRRYSLSSELAILRQRDTKVEDFERYNKYVEECKIEARAELQGGEE